MISLSSPSTTIPAVAVAAIVLVLATFGLAEDDTFFAETWQPTLPIISVTLPAGVTTDDEDIADVIDSLIRGGSYDEKPLPKPAKKPSKELVAPQATSRKETMFCQVFEVRNDREFADEELELFQDLLEQYTLYFSPLSMPEVESKITTDCTVHRQTLLTKDDDRRRLEETKPKTQLRVDFTMRYESMYYDVTEYPRLFQNWTSKNLHIVLEQMKFLNMDNIKDVGTPKRIVLYPPTSAPTTNPTISPSRSMDAIQGLIIDEPNDVGGAVIPGIDFGRASPDDVLSIQTRWSKTAIVIFSVALIIAIAILTVAVSIIVGNRMRLLDPNNTETETIRESATKINNLETDASWNDASTITGVCTYQDDTISTMDLDVVVASPVVSP